MVALPGCAAFRRRHLSSLLAAAFAGVCLPSAAAETVPPAALGEMVVSATRSEHDARTAPASVTVVDQAEIRNRNAGDLLEAVRGTPGITLTPRSVGGRKTFSLRGLEGKHTLVLIDGRRVSASDDVVGHSDYQYGWLPMEAVERIEVIRGPASSLYGSEALGGVINLVTRKPQERWAGSGALSAAGLAEGDGERNRQAVFAAGAVNDALSLRFTGEAAYAAPIAKKEDGRHSEIEGRDARSGGLAATLKLAPGQELEADWTAVDEKRYYDTVESSGLKRAYRSTYDIKRSQGGLAWRGKFDGWRGEARAYQSQIDIANTASNGASPTRPQKLTDQIADASAAFKLGGHLLTVGGEYRLETLDNAGLKGGKDDAAHKAIFVQDEFALAQNLALTAGVRGDHHEIFGSETSPRLYLVWEANRELVLKGGYGHAFRAPTLKQISPNYVGAEGPHTFLGNASVKPETADSLEIAADWRRGPLALRAAAFRNEVDDLITTTLVSVNGTRRTYRYDNVNRARIDGLETGFTWQIGGGLAWNTDLTLLSTQDKGTGKELAYRPESTVASRLDWQGGEGWSARLGLEYTGTQKDNNGKNLPSYSVWNASVGKRLDKTFSVRAGVDNIGDVRLFEKSPDFGYAERGRTVFATLRADF